MRIVFHVGGPAFHPVAEQARRIVSWLEGSGHETRLAEGLAAFDRLEECDLFVLMGLFHTGQGDPPYVPPDESRRAAFRRFVASGRPILAHHGGIASYDDWPEFGALVGFRWIWGVTSHSPLGEHRVRVTDPASPLLAGISDYALTDELYYDVWMDRRARVHAAASWDGADRPMVCSLQGRESGPGGRAVYLANGHDLRAFEAEALRRLWLNAVAWLAG